MRVESSPLDLRVGDFWPSQELALPAASSTMPWALTSSGSPLGLCHHMPANLTFICSPSILSLDWCTAFRIWGVLLFPRTHCQPVSSNCAAGTNLSVQILFSKMLGPSVVLSALHGACLIMLNNKQSLINNTGNIIT